MAFGGSSRNIANFDLFLNAWMWGCGGLKHRPFQCFPKVVRPKVTSEELLHMPKFYWLDVLVKVRQAFQTWLTPSKPSKDLDNHKINVPPIQGKVMHQHYGHLTTNRLNFGVIKIPTLESNNFFLLLVPQEIHSCHPWHGFFFEEFPPLSRHPS